MDTDLHGKCLWFFPDGDLPAPGEKPPHGHESLIILNPNVLDATIRLTVFHEDKDPDELQELTVSAQRVRCIRLDKPIGQYTIAPGQYALKIVAGSPVICQIGRMDVTQPNLAYYTVMGFSA